VHEREADTHLRALQAEGADDKRTPPRTAPRLRRDPASEGATSLRLVRGPQPTAGESL
jgi:hypothetical protein